MGYKCTPEANVTCVNYTQIKKKFNKILEKKRFKCKIP